MPTLKDDKSRNAFEGDMPGTEARTLAEKAIQRLRKEGGLFVDAVRATRMAMAVTDPTLPGNPIVFANEAFLKLSGYRMEEVLGQQPYFMNGPDTDADDVARFQEALRNDQDDLVETIQYRRDGTRFIASVLLSAFKDDDGNTVHHFLSWLDVTRRTNAENRLALLQQAQDALRESEKRLSATFEGVPAGVAAIGLDGNVIIANAEFRRFLPNGIVPSRDPERSDHWKAWDAEGRLIDPENFPTARALRGDRVTPGQEMIYTDDDGREIWVNVATVPMFGDDGQVTGVVTTITDIDESKRAEQALRKSEARLRGVLDGMGEGFGVIGPDFTILEHNREALRMDGRPKGEIVGRSHWEAFPGTEHSEVGLLLKKAMADRQPAFLEHQYRWKEGQALWLELRVYPMADGSLAAFWRDVTARKAAEEALRESEERFAQFAASTADVLWIRDGDTMELEYISPAFESVFGVTSNAVEGDLEPGAALVDPADRERVREHLDAARRGEPQTYEFRIAHGSDGGARWIRDYCFPLFDEIGRVQRIGGIARDVTELKLAEDALRDSEQHQRLLLGELQHRVRNSLAVVRSIARRTADNSDTVQTMLGHFQGRLDAFSRVQAALTRNPDGKVDLASLIEDELIAHAAKEGDQIEIEGPDILLSQRPAERISLAVHELTTNAVKHGALMNGNGRLSVRWAKDGDALLLTWVEGGVPVPEGGRRRQGFGMELLLHSLPYDLQGETKVDFTPDGLHFELRMPLDGNSSDAGKQPTV